MTQICKIHVSDRCSDVLCAVPLSAKRTDFFVNWMQQNCEIRVILLRKYDKLVSKTNIKVIAIASLINTKN